MWAPADDASMTYFTLKNFFRTAELPAPIGESLQAEMKLFSWAMGNFCWLIEFPVMSFFSRRYELCTDRVTPICELAESPMYRQPACKSFTNMGVTTKPMKTGSAYRLSKKNMTGNSCRYTGCQKQVPFELFFAKMLHRSSEWFQFGRQTVWEN